MEKTVDKAQRCQLLFVRNLYASLVLLSRAEGMMELCLGQTTSVRQKTRSGKVANRATAGVGELWPEKSMMVMVDQQR